MNKLKMSDSIYLKQKKNSIYWEAQKVYKVGICDDNIAFGSQME